MRYILVLAALFAACGHAPQPRKLPDSTYMSTVKQDDGCDYGSSDSGYIGDTTGDARVQVADTVTGAFKVAKWSHKDSAQLFKRLMDSINSQLRR